MWDYVTSSEFGVNVLQNWQSEFLAVAAMAIFTVYLRQHGSPESKQLDTPNEANEPTYERAVAISRVQNRPLATRW